MGKAVDNVIPKFGLVSENGPSTNPHGHATMFTSYVNLVKGIVGSGFLTLPHLFRRTGAGLGLALLFVGSLSTCFSLKLLAQCYHVIGVADYSIVASKALGRVGEVLIAVLQVCYSFGSCVGFLVIIRSILVSVLDTWLTPVLPNASDNLFAQHPSLVLFIASAVLVYPLCLSQRLKRLRNTSLIGLLCNLYLFLVVSYRYISVAIFSSGPAPLPPSWVHLDSGVLISLPIIAFAYNCHIQFLPVVSELREPTPSRVLFLSLASEGTCLAFYAVFALLAYSLYSDSVSDNVLTNVGTGDALGAIAHVGVAYDVCAAFPLYSVPVCKNLLLVTANTTTTTPTASTIPPTYITYTSPIPTTTSTYTTPTNTTHTTTHTSPTITHTTPVTTSSTTHTSTASHNSNTKNFSRPDDPVDQVVPIPPSDNDDVRIDESYPLVAPRHPPPDRDVNPLHLRVTTTLFYVLTLTAATFCSSLEMAFSLTGSLGASCLIFIFPALFAYILLRPFESAGTGPAVAFHGLIGLLLALWSTYTILTAS